MMVFIHSDGHSEFNDLREIMNKEINTDDLAMYRTHNELQWSAYRNYFPAFSVEIPCGLHLPNNEAALRTAWFGTGFEDLSEEGRRHAALLENIISFAANNTPIEELRKELGDRMEQIWQDFWQPKLEKCRGQQELQLSVAGGKLTFSFQVGKSDLAHQVRNAVNDFCHASGLENTRISHVIGQDNVSALSR